MSGADYFNDQQAINALMNSADAVNTEQAVIEHGLIEQAVEKAGITVDRITAEPGLQDFVYTANWAIIRNGKAILARLPNTRQPEEAFAKHALQDRGVETFTLPDAVKKFSGQGDVLAFGDTAIAQWGYRTDKAAHPYLKSVLGFSKVVSLHTKPLRRYSIGNLSLGPKVINKITGLPDSKTYDLDLAVAIIRWPDQTQTGTVAYCPAVMSLLSRYKMWRLKADKIKVSRKEALEAFALNLVSTNQTVVMNAGAPQFTSAIKARGLNVTELELPELKKGGGSIRCSTLTLSD
jgi:N-dimethylarginine dimethylaminohydrolase